MLVIMGHSNFGAPPDVRREAYAQLLDAAARDELGVDVEALPLERVAEAWARVQAGAHRKVVLLPSGRSQGRDAP